MAPVGATGESEAHSVSQTAFISASAPTPPPTLQLYPEPWTHPVPEEDQRYPPQLPIPLQSPTHHVPHGEKNRQ